MYLKRRLVFLVLFLEKISSRTETSIYTVMFRLKTDGTQEMGEGRMSMYP